MEDATASALDYAQWPKIETETFPWVLDGWVASQLSRRQRQRVEATYDAALPLFIAAREVRIPESLAARLDEVSRAVATYDAMCAARQYDLPSLLLRTESASSSQIENLTTSVKNVALAQISGQGPKNALLVAANIDAMKRAMEIADEKINLAALTDIHAALLPVEDGGGQIRKEQVWVGGSSISPHGATYIPPHHTRVQKYLDDVFEYVSRRDIAPIVQAAVAHAQLETIHPFVDGNGRTGRVLLHLILKNRGVVSCSSLPISAGLLADVDRYFAALDAYQDGNPLAMVECLADSLEIAVVLGMRLDEEMSQLLESWRARFSPRADSAAARLPNLLISNPVVTIEMVAEKMDISRRVAEKSVRRACEAGILSPLGERKRGGFYQAEEVVMVLEGFAGEAAFQRKLGKAPRG